MPEIQDKAVKNHSPSRETTFSQAVGVWGSEEISQGSEDGEQRETAQTSQFTVPISMSVDKAEQHWLAFITSESQPSRSTDHLCALDFLMMQTRAPVFIKHSLRVIRQIKHLHIYYPLQYSCLDHSRQQSRCGHIGRQLLMSLLHSAELPVLLKRSRAH